MENIIESHGRDDWASEASSDELCVSPLVSTSNTIGKTVTGVKSAISRKERRSLAARTGDPCVPCTISRMQILSLEQDIQHPTLVNREWLIPNVTVHLRETMK